MAELSSKIVACFKFHPCVYSQVDEEEPGQNETDVRGQNLAKIRLSNTPPKYGHTFTLGLML